MSNARNLANLLGTDTTIGTSDIADNAITNAKILNDAVTGAKIEDNPTIAGNLIVSGTTGLTGTVTASGATVGFVSFDKLVLNATDGSATDAGDNLILNGTDGTSANADSSILFEDETNDVSAAIISDTVTTNIANGLGKARIEKSGNNATINESFNVSSLSDDGTGICGVRMTSAFSTARYVPAGASSYTSDSGNYRQYLGTNYHNNLDETRTTSSCHHGTWEGSFADAGSQGMVYFGDLA